MKDNYIIGIINAIRKNITRRILNSCKENEEEIKDCDIFINDKKIDSYYYKFTNKGKYKIKYVFKKLLYSTNHMFSDCMSLISLDLSNFNAKYVSNMEYMFYNCKSLISIDLSNFNTQNANYMRNMFCNCKSLLTLDLSNFNTQKVYSMVSMF